MACRGRFKVVRGEAGGTGGRRAEGGSGGGSGEDGDGATLLKSRRAREEWGLGGGR